MYPMRSSPETTAPSIKQAHTASGTHRSLLALLPLLPLPSKAYSPTKLRPLGAKEGRPVELDAAEGGGTDPLLTAALLLEPTVPVLLLVLLLPISLPPVLLLELAALDGIAAAVELDAAAAEGAEPAPVLLLLARPWLAEDEEESTSVAVDDAAVPPFSSPPVLLISSDQPVELDSVPIALPLLEDTALKG